MEHHLLFETALTGHELTVTRAGVPQLRLLLNPAGGKQRSATVAMLDAGIEPRAAFAAALALLFGADTALAALEVDLSDFAAAVPVLLRRGLAQPLDAGLGRRVRCARDAFVQQPEFWLTGEASDGYPLSYRISDGKRHPLRPAKPAGAVYRRHIPWLGKMLSLRTLDAGADLERLHRWMNNPRVAFFWEEQGDLDKQRAFIAKVLADTHTHPLVACLDEEPFAYFEAYWAKEDRIAPFYTPGDHDRGIHMLVGEEWARGPHHVAAWLPSLVHYLLLDDARTQTVVCEPRIDNAKMIGYLQRYGFAYRKQFDFPHKRAALMTLEREVFAAGEWLTAP